MSIDGVEVKEASLYIGTNPKQRMQDIIPSFTGENLVPISWFFLFSPEDVVERSNEFPDSLNDFHKQSSVQEVALDSLEEYMKEPVAMRTSLPQAKARLIEFKEAFREIPYIWSYFRVIDILDIQLEAFISDLESGQTITPIKRDTPHPTKPRSQVKVKGDKTTKVKPKKVEEDNPFAALEDFGSDLQIQDTASSEGFDDLDLLSALEAATELDKLQDEIEEEAVISEEITDPDFLPVVIYFHQISGGGVGKRLGSIPLLLERLLHHAKREGRLTRIMQDYLQDIFRESQSTWRITGQLSEDFVQGDPVRLVNTMLGSPSPFVIIKESFDLEYWTAGTLQKGDERLMYSLSLLPSEQIHREISLGNIDEIKEKVGSLLVATKSIPPPILSLGLLKKSPANSNIWGFRVLIQDANREFKPATLLCANPDKSWEEDFKENINLPGVLEDWNIEYPARFLNFNDIGEYKIIFRGAKDMAETFLGFARWVRRHHILYRQKFGVNGTVDYLRKLLEETQDKEMGQLIFDMLTKLTEFGINEAVDVLSDEAIVRKLPWLYS